MAGLGCTLTVIGASLAGQYDWIPAPLAMIVAGVIIVSLGMNLAYQLGVKAGRDQS